MLEFLDKETREKIKKMGEDLAAAYGISADEAIFRLSRIVTMPNIEEIKTFNISEIEVKKGLAYYKDAKTI